MLVSISGGSKKEEQYNSYLEDLAIHKEIYPGGFVYPEEEMKSETSGSFTPCSLASAFLSASYSSDLTPEHHLSSTGLQTENSLVKSHSVRKTAKTSRKVFSDLTQNLVPSLGLDQSLGSKEFDAQITNAIPEHAYMRLQLFALTAVAIDGVAVASDPNKTRHVEVGIGRAYLQFGKGSKLFHAAHSNASAGLDDNWKVVAIGRITDEKEITPKTMRILRCKGFTDDELERLKLNSYSLKSVSECFKKSWPKENSKPDSLIAGTYLEQVLNTTMTLPKSVNLFVDKAIEEALRPYMVGLYEEIMHGKMTTETGCDLYCKAIKDKLVSLDAEIVRRIACLQNYKSDMEVFFNDSTPLNEKQDKLKSLISTYRDMRKNKLPEFKFFKMKKNELFIEKSKSKVELDAEKFQKYFSSIKNKDELLADAIAHENDLSRNQKYCALELQGTTIPPFGHLIGSIEKETVQKQLLSPMQICNTPKKKRCMIASKVATEE